MGTDDYEQGDALPGDIDQILKTATGVGGWRFDEYRDHVADMDGHDYDVVTSVESGIDGDVREGEIDLNIDVTWAGRVEDFDPDEDATCSFSLRVGPHISVHGGNADDNLRDCIDGAKRAVMGGLVNDVRAALDGLNFLFDYLGADEGDLEDTELQLVRQAADRLAERYAQDPSNEADRALAEMLAAFLEGAPQKLERVGSGAATFASIPKPFDEWWQDRV